MHLNLQVKLYPTKQMRIYLDSQCDYRRYCWNKGLELWKALYVQRILCLPIELRRKIKESLKDKTITFTEEETELRKTFPSPTEWSVRKEMTTDKNDWEYTHSSRVMYQAIKDLSDTWIRFFKKSQDNTGKPKFKSSKAPKQGFKTDRARIKNNRLLLDKPREYKGPWESIRFKGYTIPDGPIKLCAITRVKNQYIATLSMEVETTPLESTGKVTAVDANVDHFDFTEGTYTLRPQELNRLYGKVKCYQRILARKRNLSGTHSKGYQQTRTKLQQTYSKIAHVQDDLLHKFTTMLYQNYDVIVIEDLAVKKMQMNKKAKGLHRSLFGRFRQFMEYKAVKFNKQLVIADRFYPSTQRCSCCGHIKTGDDKITLYGNKKHGTTHDEYHCYECGYQDHRDHNAVLNLLALIQ